MPAPARDETDGRVESGLVSFDLSPSSCSVCGVETRLGPPSRPLAVDTSAEIKALVIDFGE